MKKILFFLLVLSMTAMADDPRVANKYLNAPEKYEGQKISLNCAYVTRAKYQEASENPSGFVKFSAYTVSRGGQYESGYIDVMVSKEAVEQFAKKYGGDSKYGAAGTVTRPLTGIFKKGSSSYYLEYTPSS